MEPIFAAAARFDSVLFAVDATSFVLTTTWEGFVVGVDDPVSDTLVVSNALGPVVLQSCAELFFKRRTRVPPAQRKWGDILLWDQMQRCLLQCAPVLCKLAPSAVVNLTLQYSVARLPVISCA